MIHFEQAFDHNGFTDEEKEIIRKDLSVIKGDCFIKRHKFAVEVEVQLRLSDRVMSFWMKLPYLSMIDWAHGQESLGDKLDKRIRETLQQVIIDAQEYLNGNK